jgi:hypothetical protein
MSNKAIIRTLSNILMVVLPNTMAVWLPFLSIINKLKSATISATKAE